MSEKYPCYILGDLNFHLELLKKSKTELTPEVLPRYKDATKFDNLLQNHDFTQLIEKPTHKASGILDVLITQLKNINSINLLKVEEKNSFCNTDHFAITFNIDTVPNFSFSKIEITKRCFKNFDINQYKADLHILLKKFNYADAESGVQLYNKICSECLDKHAPIKTLNLKSNKFNSWWSVELLRLKRKARQAERSNKISKSEKKKAINYYKQAIVDAKKQDNIEKFERSKHDPKLLYKTFNNLTEPNKEMVLPTHSNKTDLGNKFANFYVDKIDLIMQNIQLNKCNRSLNHIFSNTNKLFAGTSLACKTFDNFDPIDELTLIKTLARIKPKDSFTDPIPVWLFKECSGLLNCKIISIINKSLAEGIFPDTLKQAVVVPVVKDRSKDKNDFKNYRPISTLPFLSKLIENIVHNQLITYLDEVNLFPMFQSAYRSAHSCETAILKLTYDMEKEIYKNNLVAFISLDLSSAFDTINHTKLLNILEYKYLIKGNALKWFKSYLENRKFCVKIKNELSTKVDLKYGVPQGSVLGPLLFILYISDINSIISYHKLSMHLYADDTQLYIGIDPSKNYSITLNIINSCLEDLKTWMGKQFLKLNVEKTNVIFIGKQNLLDKHSITLKNGPNTYNSNSGEKIKLLGTILNQTLSYKDTMRRCVKSCYFNLCKLKSIRHYLDISTKIKLVHSFVLSRLNYCNIIYANSTKSDIKYMQKVINCSVRFIYNLSRRTHISDYINRCHFLSMEHRIKFKSNILTFKMLKMKDVSPEYLRGVFTIKNFTRNTRGSSDIFILNDTDSTGRKFDKNSIVFKMVQNWNELPADLRHLENFDRFLKDLKTYYFSLWLNEKGLTSGCSGYLCKDKTTN